MGELKVRSTLGKQKETKKGTLLDINRAYLCGASYEFF
jgi:hypothetical protein